VKFPIRLGKFKSRILAGALGLLLALTLAVAFTAPVSVALGRPPPHQFWGTVSIDSVPAPEGTEVVARIANVTQNFTTAVAANHTYGWSPIFYVLADDPNTTEKDGGNDGDIIDFYVAGIWATNFTFSSGSSTELNLTVPGCNLTVNVTGNGNVTINGTTPSLYPNTTTWVCGTVVNLTATPDTYWYFVNWTTANMSEIANTTAASTNVTVDANKTVTANFAQVNYTLTMAVSGNGTTTPTGVNSYANGTVVNITATPDTYWYFVNWSGNVTNHNSTSTNITMSYNETVTANFARVNYTLTMAVSGNGTTTPTGVNSYANGTVVNITATPDTYWYFVNWTGDVGTIANGTAANTTINMTGNYSICANFAIGVATLEGHVSFTGRGTSPEDKWIEDFVVRFFQGGSEMAWSPINATTNDTGVFNITGLAPGTYDIGIKNWTCLSEVVTGVTLTVGNTTVVDFGTTREGDSNNDDWIVLSDRTILYTGWGSQSPNPGYNAHADFNRDGWLTLADRTIMYTYWAQHGDLVS